MTQTDANERPAVGEKASSNTQEVIKNEHEVDQTANIPVDETSSTDVQMAQPNTNEDREGSANNQEAQTYTTETPEEERSSNDEMANTNTNETPTDDDKEGSSNDQMTNTITNRTPTQESKSNDVITPKHEFLLNTKEIPATDDAGNSNDEMAKINTNETPADDKEGSSNDQEAQTNTKMVALLPQRKPSDIRLRMANTNTNETPTDDDKEGSSNDQRTNTNTNETPTQESKSNDEITPKHEFRETPATDDAGSSNDEFVFISNNHVGAKFLGSLPAHHQCFICHDILRNPKQTHPCGHRFCSSCLNTELYDRGSCPKCQQHIEQTWPDNGKVRELMELLVLCTNGLCNWKGKLAEIREHKKTCHYEMVNCQNDDCKMNFCRKNLESHMSNNCLYRFVDCQWCEDKYQKISQQRHDGVCSQFPLKCDNECGETIARKDMQKHIEEECERTIHPCEHQPIECDFQGTRNDLMKHTEEAENHHFYLKLNTEVNRRIDITFEEINLLKSKLITGEEQQFNDINTLKLELENQLKFCEENHQNSLNNYEQSQRNLEEHITESNNRMDMIEDTIEKHEEFKQCLEEQHHEISTRTNEIGRKIENFKNETEQINKVNCSKISEHNNVLTKQYHQIQELKEITKHLPDEMDKLFGEITVLEPQRNMLPNRSLLFVIEDFQEKFRTSKDENSLIYSDSFYCLRGYRAIICMFMNGWHNGINNHISCYFEVLKGPFDDALDWPLQMKMKFSIKEKDGDDFQLGFDTTDISCDDLERHFGRPKDVGNIAWGFSCFLNHRDVNKYVFGDTMKICIDISPSAKQGRNHSYTQLDANLASVEDIA